jgi:hypothetical protein
LKAPHVRKTVKALTKFNLYDRGPTRDRPQQVSTQKEAWFTPDAKQNVPQIEILSKND